MTSTAATEWTSPLRAIERAAQEAAKQQALDMGEPGARQQLRALLDEQVARWQRDYRKGLRPLDIADPEAAVERALAEPDRLWPPRAVARRPGRVGNHGQRTRLHFHQTTFRRRGIPPRGVPRRRTRHPGAHQDPR